MKDRVHAVLYLLTLSQEILMFDLLKEVNQFFLGNLKGFVKGANSGTGEEGGFAFYIGASITLVCKGAYYLILKIVDEIKADASKPKHTDETEISL